MENKTECVNCFDNRLVNKMRKFNNLFSYLLRNDQSKKL